MKSLLSVVFLSVALAANASFELALLSTGDGNIVRYDPVNRVLLGSFAHQEVSTFNTMTLDRNDASKLHVFTGSSVKTFDWSTGQFVSSFRVGQAVFSSASMTLQSLPSGQLLVSGIISTGGPASSLTRIMNSDGTTAQTLSTFGLNISAGTYASDGSIYLLGRTGSSPYAFTVLQYTSTGVFLNSRSLASSTNADSYGNISTINGELILSAGNLFSTMTFQRLAFGLGSAPANVPAGFWVTTGWSNVVAGHGGRGHFTQSFVNSSVQETYWYRYDSVDNFVGNYHKINGLTTPVYSVALVTAPEPASMVALAFGGTMLLIRRRRKAS